MPLYPICILLDIKSADLGEIEVWILNHAEQIAIRILQRRDADAAADAGLLPDFTQVSAFYTSLDEKRN